METARRDLAGSMGRRFAARNGKHRERTIRELFRPVVTLFATLLSPWAWSVAQKQPHRINKLRAVAAIVAICAVLIAPMMLSAGIHFTSGALECAAVGCGMAWIIGGTAIVAALCAGLVGPAAVACAVTFAA
jgi:hypothetical protein